MDDTGNAELNYCYNCMKRLESGQMVCPDCGYDNSVNHNPQDALPEGTMLAGHYLLGKVLGQGGFGITYLGVDIALDKRVAIKEYFPRLVCSRMQGTNRVTGIDSLSHPEDFRNGMEEFGKEAQTLAQISSPNIVRVLYTFRENGTAYIVMEYADGISLGKEVMDRGGRLPWQRVTDLFKDLIRELGKLHEKHLIHRDIKPDNLRIVKDEDGEERLVLLDFGTARSFASAEVSQTYTAMLTPGYAPLEQYSTKGKQGPYTDIYALCATMYTAITGKIPPGASDRSMGDARLEGINEHGVKVPERVEKAILHGLKVQREDRPQTMGELYAELYGAEPKPIPDDPKELIYQAGMKMMASGSREGYEKALALFGQIPGWKDADEMAAFCRRKVRGEVPTINTGGGSKPPEPKPDPKKWLFILLLAALIGGGVFYGLKIRKEQEAFRQTQTAFYLLQSEAAETKTPQQTAIAETETARKTQEALSVQQTGTVWNLTAAAELQHTQTQAAIEAGATQAEQESQQTATAWFMTQEAQLHQTETRIVEDLRETQAFFNRQTAEVRKTAAALEQTRVMAEQLTETAFAEQTLSAQQTATRSAERMAREAALEETQYAFHMMETEASFAETQVAIDMRMTGVAATKTKAAEPTSTPTPEATLTPTMTNTPEPTATPTKRMVSAGDIITMGRYEQDGNWSNGTESIEWQVLAVEEDRALVISKYGLDAKPYNEKLESMTWETSTLRAWLNGEFYNSAFSEAEKAQIQEVRVKNANNPSYGTKGGNDTTDRIFLLSIEEAKQYFADDEAGKCRPTTYAKNNGAYVSDSLGTTWWWLRSPGNTGNRAAVVDTYGSVYRYGYYVNYTAGSARPAFWLDSDVDLEIVVSTAKSTPIPAEIPILTLTPEPTSIPTTKLILTGDIITFGQYEQDGNLSNGAEAIEWHVLAVEGDRALVISKYGLDAKPYNEKLESMTWETSTLRAWLNGEFYNSAFSEAEKAQIQEVRVKNAYNPSYRTKGGNDTTDRIFLLSIEEAEQYFADDEAGKCQPTTYAINNGVYFYKKTGMAWWWLRSPGYVGSNAAAVTTGGSINYGGSIVFDSAGSARPAFWLNL